jgi:uncharacterized lipoprotein YmbA
MSMSSRLRACLLVLFAAGCTPTPASRLYMLQAPEGASAMQASSDGPTIFVDPAVVATSADRTQLVTRRQDGSVHLDEFDAWAEPPGEQVTAVLVDGLAARFGADKVLATPRQRDFAPNFRITVDVLRLEADDAGNVLVDARWALFAGPDDRFVSSGRERLLEPTAVRDVPARMAGFNRALAYLADQLAQTVRAETGGRPGQVAARQPR